MNYSLRVKVNKNNIGSTASKPDWCDYRPEVFSIKRASTVIIATYALYVCYDRDSNT